MQTITLILNDAPYGSERSYNGLRTAIALQKANAQVNVFLIADSVYCALKDQTTPEGYYNIGRMIRGVTTQGKIGSCGVCMDARGLSNLQLIDGVQRSSMAELANWILTSDKIITF
ncbi:MAG: DsrE/DsrF/TusD sulfur relay family protein [Candidatus Hodarchaeales archaeon]|jgi:uncharacterized protein involved in oxidation of intracellular sulfur